MVILNFDHVLRASGERERRKRYGLLVLSLMVASTTMMGCDIKYRHDPIFEASLAGRCFVTTQPLLVAVPASRDGRREENREYMQIWAPLGNAMAPSIDEYLSERMKHPDYEVVPYGTFIGFSEILPTGTHVRIEGHADVGSPVAGPVITVVGTLLNGTHTNRQVRLNYLVYVWPEKFANRWHLQRPPEGVAISWDVNHDYLTPCLDHPRAIPRKSVRLIYP